MKRNEGESFEDYKSRRANQNRVDKFRAKGILGWDSRKKGTFNRLKEMKKTLKKGLDTHAANLKAFDEMRLELSDAERQEGEQVLAQDYLNLINLENAIKGVEGK